MLRYEQTTDIMYNLIPSQVNDYSVTILLDQFDNLNGQHACRAFTLEFEKYCKMLSAKPGRGLEIQIYGSQTNLHSLIQIILIKSSILSIFKLCNF